MNQGLKHLAITAQKNRIQFKDSSKVAIIPLFAFIDELLSSMKKYINSPEHVNVCSWGEFLAVSCSDKQFSNVYGSWLVYNGKSLECKLMSMLLGCRSGAKIGMFLKLRKYVMKTQPETNTNLDQIQLQHSDIIGILHNIYPNPQSKKQITQGIKSLFISYKMQQAKICSCVFIEYALSLHNDIHQRENNQATISQQQESYGTVPQSILGYSSVGVGERSLEVRRGGDGGRVHGESLGLGQQGHGNASQYVSNFQSVIHDQNGLYRKIKSSQVSLQGFKVIDHKFINNSPPKNSIVQPQNSIPSPKSNPPTKQNPPILIKQQNSPTPYSNKTNKKPNQFQIYTNQNPKPVYNIKYSNIRPSTTSPQKYQSPSYSDRFKSPDISYQVTPDVGTHGTHGKSRDVGSRVNRSLAYESGLKNDRYTLHPPQIQSSHVKLIKHTQSNQQPQRQPQPSPQQQKPPKQSGYDMFKKLTERNKSFMQKMLKSNIDRRHEAMHPGNQHIHEEKPAYQSINLIHDSIVRHSKVDRWTDSRVE